MASAGKEYREELEELSEKETELRARTRTLAGQQAEAKRLLQEVEEAKCSKVLEALDAVKKKYFYEVTEPKLLEEEEELLDVLKEILVESLELLEDATPPAKEQYLRRVVDGLLRELGVELHSVSKERVMYYLFRDFIRFGPIDVTMIDTQVEDISCDGVGVPFYIYHRKYGSIPSNLKFDTAEELDSFVVWLAQRCGKHISVALPMLDATVPDGSRLQATLGMHVTKRGSSFTIRRFRENPFSPLDLVRFKTISPEV